MASKKKIRLNRFYIIIMIFAAVCVIYTIRLVNMQITGADYYTSAKARTYPREVVIQSVRGEIFDRNGKALVTNTYTNTIQLDYNAFMLKSDAKNNAIARLYLVLDSYGAGFSTHFPVSGTYPHVSYDTDALENARTSARFKSFLEKNELDEGIGCVEFYEFLLDEYGVRAADGSYSYKGEVQSAVIAVRYELDTMNFSPDNPFVIMKQAQLQVITSVLERAPTGIYIKKEWSRVYNYPSVASHILGRVGKIPQEKAQQYLDLGYKLDATVGLDGAEAAFEDYLRGTDGVMIIEEDEDGNEITSYVQTPAIPGKNVYLTIDIDLQIASEKALADNIAKIVADALESGEKNTGEDADSGGVSVVNPNNGEVLALASYPTYDLSTFLEEYASLSTDERRPLFNRALWGNFEPGSTFKVATAAAALTNGIITSSTEIECTGKYRYYSDYQPSCWYKYGHSHISVVEALGVSCNCFFFEAARLTGIERLNEYFSTLGLGEYTGIELPESRGVLAGPVNNSEKNLGVWNPGDTIQAGIGQSHNAVTPLQLSTYISTVINGGTRYKATILYKVENYSHTEETYNQPVVLNTVNLSPAHCAVLKQGMKSSKELTSTTRRYAYPIGSKTGTAQISTVDYNAVFTAFAPYDNPQITITCTIENGATGRYAAPCALDIISYYFGLDKNGNPLPDETEEAEETDAPHTSPPAVKPPETESVPVTRTEPAVPTEQTDEAVTDAPEQTDSGEEQTTDTQPREDTEAPEQTTLPEEESEPEGEEPVPEEEDPPPDDE